MMKSFWVENACLFHFFKFCQVCLKKTRQTKFECIPYMATASSSLQILLLCSLMKSFVIAMLRLNSVIFFATVHIITVNELVTDLWHLQIHYFLFHAWGTNSISAVFSTLHIIVSYSTNWSLIGLWRLLSLTLQICRKWCYGIYKTSSLCMSV